MKLKRAFTLIELLIVIAIISVLVALIVPAISSIGRGQALGTAAQTFTATLELARQNAVSQNRRMEVRLYKMAMEGQPASAASEYCAMQTFVVDYDATTAFDKVTKFPSPAIISGDKTASTLLNDTAAGTAADPKPPAEQTPVAGMNLPIVGTTYKYRSIFCKPDGTIDLPFIPPATSPAVSKVWTLTFINKNEPIKANNLPANYATIQIEPINGRTKVTRP